MPTKAASAEPSTTVSPPPAAAALKQKGLGGIMSLISQVLAEGKVAKAEKAAAEASAGGGGADSPPARIDSVGLLRLWGFARPEIIPLSVGVGTLALTTGISLVFPAAIGSILDVALNPDSVMSLDTMGVGLMGLFLVQSAAITLRSALLAISGERIAAAMRGDLLRATLAQEVAWFDERRTGDIITRINSDVNVVQKNVTSNIANGLRSVAMTGGCVGMLFYISPSLAALSLCLIPPVAVGGMYYGRFLQGRQRAVQEALSRATAISEELLSSLRTVRQFGREAREASRFEGAIAEAYTVGRRIGVVSAAFDGALHLSANIALVAVLWYGGHLVYNGSLTAGELTSFVMYSIYSGFNITSLSSIYSDLKRASGAAGRIVEILDRAPRMPLSGQADLWGKEGGAIALYAPPTTDDISKGGGELIEEGGLLRRLKTGPSRAALGAISSGLQIPDLASIKGEVRFDNVSFAYPTRPNAPVLRNFSLTLPAGKTLALVGGSGTGKSTVGALLTRLYDVSDGRITLDGVDIREIDPTWLRSVAIGTVSQEPTLFPTSILENIRFGKPDATLEQVVEAARLANIHDTIVSMPKGYETLVGERGIQLSGGQRQRVAIARACIKNSPIMIQDESTSSLDSESEFAVLAALDRVRDGRSVISIAHRLSTMRHADIIAVMADGAVAEVGSFDELMKKGTLFATLVNSQRK